MGGAAPLDPSSVEASKDDKVSTDFLKKEHLWKDTVKLESLVGKAKEYDAIFYVGGHGRELYSYHLFGPRLTVRKPCST